MISMSDREWRALKRAAFEADITVSTLIREATGVVPEHNPDTCPRLACSDPEGYRKIIAERTEHAAATRRAGTAVSRAERARRRRLEKEHGGPLIWEDGLDEPVMPM